VTHRGANASAAAVIACVAARTPKTLGISISLSPLVTADEITE
jgi:hypothetical protein